MSTWCSAATPRHSRTPIRWTGCPKAAPWSGNRKKKARRPGSACPCGRASKSSTRRFAFSPCRVSKSPATRPIARTCNCECRETLSWARSLRCRRFSQEFRITPEQFREVVHKQYVKKFGRLGDAVVNSNMEVMTQGFEQVREIRVGEMEAPDRSTLRGHAAVAGGPGHCDGRRLRLRVPLASAPRRPGRAHACDAHCHVRFRVPLQLRLQPAGFAVCLGGRHGRRQRGHRFQICRAPRNASLHSGKLHAVHGVHRGLSGHGAAELLAGFGHRAADRHRELRDGPGRAPEDAAVAAGD